MPTPINTTAKIIPPKTEKNRASAARTTTTPTKFANLLLLVFKKPFLLAPYWGARGKPIPIGKLLIGGIPSQTRLGAGISATAASLLESAMRS